MFLCLLAQMIVRVKYGMRSQKLQKLQPIGQNLPISQSAEQTEFRTKRTQDTSFLGLIVRPTKILGEISVFLFLAKARTRDFQTPAFMVNTTLCKRFIQSMILENTSFLVATLITILIPNPNSKVFWPKIMTIFQVCISWMQTSQKII